jgi:hypothetical protein
MAHFLLRLNPPRPSFISDMTEEEAGLMQQHASYMASAAGVVLYGPVAEPSGAWGLAIVSVADENAARSITAGDPLIRSGAGFSYDVIPMLTAVPGGAYAEFSRA